MALRIVHFGKDECLRLAVLLRAGYRVDESGTSIFSLARLLMKEASDAIAISEDDKECDRETIRLARSLSPAPIVLFVGVNRKREEAGVDLAIGPLTRPWEWLNNIEGLIRRSKILPDLSAGLRKNAQAARAESASARQRTAEGIERARLKSNGKF